MGCNSGTLQEKEARIFREIQEKRLENSRAKDEIYEVKKGRVKEWVGKVFWILQEFDLAEGVVTKEIQELKEKIDGMDMCLEEIKKIEKIQGEIEEIEKRLKAEKEKIPEEMRIDSKSYLARKKLQIKQVFRSHFEGFTKAYLRNLSSQTQNLTESGVDLLKISKNLKKNLELAALNQRISILESEIKALNQHKEDLTNNSDDSLDELLE